MFFFPEATVMTSTATANFLAKLVGCDMAAASASILDICVRFVMSPVKTRILKRTSAGRRSCSSQAEKSARRIRICGGIRWPTMMCFAHDWYLGSTMHDGPYWTPVPDMKDRYLSIALGQALLIEETHRCTA